MQKCDKELEIELDKIIITAQVLKVGFYERDFHLIHDISSHLMSMIESFAEEFESHNQ